MAAGVRGALGATGDTHQNLVRMRRACLPDSNQSFRKERQRSNSWARGQALGCPLAFEATCQALNLKERVRKGRIENTEIDLKRLVPSFLSPTPSFSLFSLQVTGPLYICLFCAFSPYVPAFLYAQATTVWI